ncbi:zinc finger protein 664-like [Periplaneta americana]|uniref:zinc finger protein 664-like n=1 Tax=Periplaneta americana TaxID=6978 RepID=UPI0037E998F4
MDVIKMEPDDDPFGSLPHDNTYKMEEMKASSEERNFLDQHVTGIKEEYVDQSRDLTSQIKFAEDPVPISLPVVKCVPEETHSDMDTVSKEPWVELTTEDNKILTERIAGTSEKTVSSELDGIAHEENENSCEILKISTSPGKLMWTCQDEKPLDFEVSKLAFFKSVKLNGHLPKLVGKKSLKCEVCGICFPTSSKLKTHQRRHTGEKPFKCEVCGKCFSQLGTLKYHARLHTGEKPFKCDVCGKSFALMGNLNIHERVHTGEKRFKCDVCGKCFSQSSSLKNHENRHTDNKPLKCGICGKCFSTSKSLKSHERFHTNEKPFQCLVCGRYFSHSCNLKSHERGHTGDKLYKCEVSDNVSRTIVP